MCINLRPHPHWTRNANKGSQVPFLCLWLGALLVACSVASSVATIDAFYFASPGLVWMRLQRTNNSHPSFLCQELWRNAWQGRSTLWRVQTRGVSGCRVYTYLAPLRAGTRFVPVITWWPPPTNTTCTTCPALWRHHTMDESPSSSVITRKFCAASPVKVKSSRVSGIKRPSPHRILEQIHVGRTQILRFLEFILLLTRMLAFSFVNEWNVRKKKLKSLGCPENKPLGNPGVASQIIPTRKK